MREFELGLGLPMITTSSNVCGSNYRGFFQPLWLFVASSRFVMLLTYMIEKDFIKISLKKPAFN